MASIVAKEIALVTGANSGIGFEIAHQLLQRGNFHVLLGSRSTSKGSAALQDLQSRNLAGSVELVHLDVQSDEHIQQIAASIKEKQGKLDLLFNNAAVALPDGATEREKLTTAFDVNATGPWLLSKALIPLLKKSQNPRIINISSGAGSIGRRLSPESPMYKIQAVQYRASKVAFNMLTACLHVEYGLGIEQQDKMMMMAEKTEAEAEEKDAEAGEEANKKIKVFCYDPGFTASNLGPHNKEEFGARSAKDTVTSIMEIVDGKRDEEVDCSREGFLTHGFEGVVSGLLPLKLLENLLFALFEFIVLLRHSAELTTPASPLNDTLNTLPTAKDAPFNAFQRQHDPTCLPDTRVDLLRDIRDWADGDDSPSIFWLSGLAGTGKTTIAHTVAAQHHAKGRLAASFFFSRAGGDVSHAGKFITSIAVQLASNIPGLRRKICDAILKHSDIASQSLDEQWRELVLGPLSRLENKEGQLKYVLVVDALDECGDQNNVQIILQRLAEVQSLQGVQLRVLLTSRPEVPIQYGFTQVRQEEHRDFVLHDIEPAVIEHDIAVFLRHRLGLIRKKCGLEAGWPEESAIARLVQNSGGLFIWAATACRFIAEDSQLAETRLCSLLHQGGSSTLPLPPERKLDEIYTTVLTSSMRGEYTEAESQTLHQLFRQIVGPIVTMQDPLSVASLAELLGKNVKNLRRTLANLHSVLDVPESDSSAIRLLHPSFRDFLLSSYPVRMPVLGVPLQKKRRQHRQLLRCRGVLA
ncbi:cysteine synthase [Stemphylium lycopersici]|nr:cysteine synthase [Stemphylium lycopersici]